MSALRNNDINYPPHRALALILAAVVLTRLPFVFSGYGADPDAWLVASAASELWHSGRYIESRLPGYPLHEIVSAPAVGMGGAPLANMGTLAASLCAITVWYHLSRRWAHRPNLLLVAFALAPAFWQHSAETVDYVWSLTFILLALNRALARRYAWCGVFAGVAAGFRPSNVVMIIPLVAVLAAMKAGRRALMLLVTTAAITTLLTMLPPIVRHGGVFEWFLDTRAEMSDLVFTLTERVEAFLYRSVYFLGPLASLLLLVGVLRERARLRTALRTGDPMMVGVFVTIATFLLLFFWLPLDRAYLLPILPWTLLLVDKLFSLRMLVVWIVAFVLHGGVNLDVVRREEGKKVFGFNVHAGMVIEEVSNRNRLLEERQSISRRRYPSHSIVMTGSGSAFWFDNRDVDVLPREVFSSLQAIQASALHRAAVQQGTSSVIFLPYLTLDEVRRFRDSGYTVFCTERALPYVQRIVGYDLPTNDVRLVR